MATPHSVAAASCDMLAALRVMLATLGGVSATQDTHGNSRGLEGPSGGVLYMKNFYGLELIKIILVKEIESDNWHQHPPPPQSDKNNFPYFFYSYAVLKDVFRTLLFWYFRLHNSSCFTLIFQFHCSYHLITLIVGVFWI